MGAEAWVTLKDQWTQDIGAFDEIAICERPQPFRSGIVLLLIHSGKPVAFLKLREGEASVLHEYQLMGEIWRFQPRCFSIPEPFGVGSACGWNYLATAALRSSQHRVPRKPPLDEIGAEINAALQALQRPTATPDHWQPMHGDFTPWNLRELPGGGLVLYDWEDSAWGPPEADDVLYRASAAALRNSDPGVHHAREAVLYWSARLKTRSYGSKRDQRLARSLYRTLEQMQGQVKRTDEVSQAVAST